MQAGEIGFIKVNLESNKLISTLVTVNIFDSELTSIGIGSVKTALASGNSEIILSFMIPDDASLGMADIYVNAFSDWVSNGGIPLTREFAISEFIANNSPTPQPIPEPTAITVKTDQTHYDDNDIITISGSIKTLAEYSQSVTIVVVSPDGNIVTIAQVIPSSDGSFSTNMDAGNTMNRSGIYEVRAQYGGQKITNTFIFSGGNNIPEPTPEPEPNSNSIVVTTNKASYSEGEIIYITGEVRDLYSGTPVSVIVKAPNGNLVSISQVEVKADKKFSLQQDAGGSLMKTEGGIHDYSSIRNTKSIS